MLWAFCIISRYFTSLSLRASRIFFFSEISVTTTVPPFFASSGSRSRAWRVQADDTPAGPHEFAFRTAIAECIPVDLEIPADLPELLIGPEERAYRFSHDSRL